MSTFDSGKGDAKHAINSFWPYGAQLQILRIKSTKMTIPCF